MVFNKKRYYYIVIIFTVLSIISAYQLMTSTTAEEALIRAGNRVYAKSGYSFDIQTILSIDDVVQEINFNGVVANNDIVYMEGIMGGFPIKIYRIKGVYYVLNPFNKKWVTSEEMGIDLKGLAEPPGEFLSWLNLYSGKTVFGETENYNGIRCKVVTIYPDDEGMKNLIRDLNSPIEMDDTYSVNFSIEYWIGQRDYLVYRIKNNLIIELPNGNVHSMNVDTKIHSYTDNAEEPVLPEELKILF